MNVSLSTSSGLSLRDIMSTSVVETRKFQVSTLTYTKVLNPVYNILKPTGYVMHYQFNIQQLYALPTLYLCVLCLLGKF